MKDHANHDAIEFGNRHADVVTSRIDGLDVKPLVEVLTREQPDGLGWINDRAELAVAEYKKFLVLNVLYPKNRIVPNRLVDEVWHTHILDTRKYAADCENFLGFFLHHFPYFGQRGDEEQRDCAYETTSVLYEREFGPSPLGTVVGSAVRDIRAAGCDAGDIRAAGCDAGDIRAAGCDAGDIRAAGCDAGDIRAAGCDAGDIRVLQR